MPSTGIFLFDRDLRYLSAQCAGRPVAGFTSGGLEGKTIWEALPPETCRTLEPRYRAALAGEASAAEIPFAGRTYTTNIMPVRDREGSVRCGLVVVQEVTVADRIDDELLQNQARYRHLLESITGYTYTTTYFEDRPAVTTHSPGVHTVTGYVTEDYLANPYLWLEMVDPADRPAVKQHVAAALCGDLVPPLEHRIHHRSGELRWVRNTLVARRDPETGRLTADGLIEDISERKRAELALQQSEERFRMLTEASFEGIGISEGGLVIDVNDQILAILGYGRDDLLGRNVAELVAPESQERVATAMRGNEATYEHWMLRKDGTRVLMEARGRALDVGERRLRVTALRDITEKKRAEQALRESEERFRTLAEESSDGIFLADPRGRYQDVNPAGSRMLGYSRDEIRTLAIADIVVSEEIVRVQPETGRLRHDRVVRTEWRFQRKDGSSFDGEVDARLLSDGRILGVVRDITERRRAEAERREFERLLQDTQRLEALGTLAGGVAHDFNNILAAIFAHLALARMDLERDHPLQSVLGDISELSERARDLVRQILAFSRAPSDQREQLDLAREVKEAARLVRATIPTTVEVRTEFDADVPLVRADATQIHRVIVNLCTNAWHAIGARPGCITLKLGVEEVDAGRAAEDPRKRQGRFVVLGVDDTGAGIDAETIARIFEPFFTTKGGRQGTGLGLAIVHGIVRAHGGFVIVRSAPDQGSEFRIYLPVARDSSSEIPPARTVVREAKGSGRVLFLDDEPQVGRACSRLLTRAGYEVATYHLPSEALADFRRDPTAYDVVITDMTMPEMDGLAFSQAVRASRPDVPIILATGYSALLTETTAAQLAIQALIYKPLDPNEFVDIVRRVLAGEHSLVP